MGLGLAPAQVTLKLSCWIQPSLRLLYYEKSCSSKRRYLRFIGESLADIVRTR